MQTLRDVLAAMALSRVVSRLLIWPRGLGTSDVRSPTLFLMLLAAAMSLSHQTWMTLLNNFAVTAVDFTGREIGILQSIREIPGFLAFGVVFLLWVMREQTLALVCLLVLAIGTAATGYFPSELGFYATCLIMSIGFHFYETAQQSLSLQWFEKETAPRELGRVLAAGSFASLACYGMIYITWSGLGLAFEHVYLLAGLITAGIVVYAWRTFPQFPQPVVQNKGLILRRDYWLYYALTFMSGARRQIFIVFAGFLMVEKFGYSVTAITTLFLLNHLMTMLAAPYIGRLIMVIGERRALMIEYVGLIGVFVAYAFVTDPYVAGALYVIDHAFFAMAIAMKTYFQKIADPADMAPTAGVAFTINHIAAVFLPVALGFVWLQSSAAVFLIGAGFAVISLVLSFGVPGHPSRAQPFAWAPPRATAPAE